jgi:hypothetical protein
LGKTKSGRRPSPRPRDFRLACIAALTAAAEAGAGLEICPELGNPVATASSGITSWAGAKVAEA